MAVAFWWKFTHQQKQSFKWLHLLCPTFTFVLSVKSFAQGEGVVAYSFYISYIGTYTCGLRFFGGLGLKYN